MYVCMFPKSLQTKEELQERGCMWNPSLGYPDHVHKYSVDIYLLCMIKFLVSRYICSMWRMLLPGGKSIGLLLFCLLLLFLLSILFFKPNLRTYKTIQGMSSLALHGNHFSS